MIGAAFHRMASGIGVAMVMLVAVTCGQSPAAIGSQAKPQGTWYLSALGVDMASPRQDGRGELIAVLDTGLDSAALPSFSARLVEPWNQIALQPGAADDNGHGTEMAVIAAGGGDLGAWGLAPGAEVMPIKVADADGQAAPHVVANAIKRAVTAHATVIHISLATEVRDNEIAAAIATAIGMGVVIVAAAGDVGEVGPQFPASEPGVVAVYAQDRTGRVVARFNSPVGPAALAPGVDVDTLAAGSVGLRWVRVSGTSVAAAIVSGLLADCLSAEAAAGQPRRDAIATCHSRMIRSSEVPGFLGYKAIVEV